MPVADRVVEAYFKQLAKYPKLSWPEQEKLFKRYAESGRTDHKIRNTLYNANLSYVVSVAQSLNRGFVRQGTFFMDLVQAGNEGLLTAVNKFDLAKGVFFSTYATYWIRARMMLELKFLVSPFKVKNTTRVGELPRTESLDAPIQHSTNHDADRTLFDLLQAPPEHAPDELVIHADATKKIESVLRVLSAKERFIFMNYGRTTTTYGEIGEKYGVSRQRVEQIHRRAKEKVDRRLRFLGFNAVEGA